MSVQQSTGQNGNGRNPLLILGGAILLGIAFALLLFGGNLFGADSNQSPDNIDGGAAVLGQAPELAQVQPDTLEIPGRDDGFLEVGDTAYDFVLNDLDGNSVALGDLRGRPVVVNFWATWCAPCRIEMPELQAAFEKYEDEGLAILAIDQNESPEVVRDFFYGEIGLTFTPLLDEGGDISNLYRVSNLPSTFFINSDGVVTIIHRGLMVREQIEGYLAETIPGEG